MQYLDIILRSLAVYIFIVVAIRLFGKKELSQLTVIDLVFILLISNSVQNAMVGPDSSLLGGMAAAATLFIVNYLLKLVLYRNPEIEKMIEGESMLLIYKGKLNLKNLDKSKITIAELEAVVREHGVASIGEVDLSMLETDGNISVLTHNFTKQSTRKRKAHKVLTQQQ